MDKIDSKEFIEKYCLVNGEHIQLKDYQYKLLEILERYD